MNLGFVLSWFGDSLDGTLARYRHTERPVYGFYIDHAVDAFVEMMIILGLGLSPYVRFDLACLALIGYFLLSILVFIRTCVKGEFVLSYGRRADRDAFAGHGRQHAVYFIGNPTVNLFSLTLTIYDWLVAIIILTIFAIAISTTLIQARLLARMEKERQKLPAEQLR